MSRLVYFVPDASADVERAVAWYEEQWDGLGQRFLDRLEQAIERIAKHPQVYQPVDEDVRRAVLKRFPYSVFFVAEPERIVVLAVLHGRRDPAEWKQRR